MIRERYDAMRLFELVPALQLGFEPELAMLDVLLEGDALFQTVKSEMRTLRHTRCPLVSVTRVLRQQPPLR